MLKVSTMGVPMSGNKGSASMLLGMLDSFAEEFDEIEFNVFTYYPRVDKKLNEYPNVNIYSGTPQNLVFAVIPASAIVYLFNKMNIRFPKNIFGKEIEALMDSDIIIDVGGTTFKDEKVIKLLYNVACLAPGLLLQKKVVKYSQTMGPFNNYVNRHVAQYLLPKLDLIIARGRKSEKHLQELGLKNCVYCADAAFTMSMDDNIVLERMRSLFDDVTRNKANYRGVVGISPNSIVEKYCTQNHMNHAEIFGNFINYLIDSNYFVLLIPHSYRANAKVRHNNDLFTIQEICEYVKKPDSFYVVNEDFSPKELRALIGLTDYYVASRFHSMISALATGVPVLVFGWGTQKYLEVMQEFELESFTFGYQDLNIESMCKHFENLVANADTIREKIRINLPNVRSSSKSQLDYVKEVLKANET